MSQSTEMVEQVHVSPKSTGRYRSYHTRTCRYWKRADRLQAWTRKKAEEWGYEHCKTCASGEGHPLGTDPVNQQIRVWVLRRLDEQGSPTYFKSKDVSGPLEINPKRIGVRLARWDSTDSEFVIVKNGSATYKAVRVRGD